MNPLEISRGSFRYFHAGSDRAGDGHHLRNTVINHRCTGGAVSGNNVDYTGWQVLGANLGQEQSALRGRIRGLENGRVTGGNSGSKFPHRHVQRIVPRGDLTNHADGLATNHGSVIFHVLASAETLKVSCRPSEESNLVNTEHDFIINKTGSRLASVLRLKVSKFFSPFFHLIGDAEQSQLALSRCRISPGFKSGCCGSIGGVNIGVIGNWRVGVDGLGCGINEFQGVLAARIYIFAIDEVFERGSCHGVTLTQSNTVRPVRKIISI